MKKVAIISESEPVMFERSVLEMVRTGWDLQGVTVPHGKSMRQVMINVPALYEYQLVTAITCAEYEEITEKLTNEGWDFYRDFFHYEIGGMTFILQWMTRENHPLLREDPGVVENVPFSS